MKIQEFIDQIIAEFGFPPTHDQLHALETFGRFLADRDQRSVMIMRGSAGTGKTSLAGAMVRTFHRLGQKLQLMAPTGRAAKVFSRNCGLPAYTIHRRIYREKAYTGLNGDFSLNNNMYKNTLFMIDEASMCSSDLLPDLVSYVYSGDNCRMLLIGDKAQLPPVGEDEAPALDADVLQYAGLRVYECDLNEVLRQSNNSGILYNATMVRQMITHDEATELPKISFNSFADIVMMPGNEIVDVSKRLLIDDYIRMVKAKKPLMFVIENVRQFITKENGKYLERVLSGLPEYNITYSVVNDNEVGGYTKRERMILVGSVKEMGKIIIPNVELANAHGFAKSITFQATYKNLLVYEEKLAKYLQAGIRFRPDFSAKKIYFELYAGVNRTLSQSDVPRVVFSDEYNNLTKISYTNNEQLYSNVCYVGGQGEGENRTYVIAGDDSLTGLERREVFLSSSDVSPNNQTDEQYKASLKQRGDDKLNNSGISLSVEASVNPIGNFIYKTDYDLGDLVTIKNTKFGINIDERITEVTEIYEGGAFSVSLTFGTPIPETIDWTDAIN